jgi:hypothetical protein
MPSLKIILTLICLLITSTHCFAEESMVPKKTMDQALFFSRVIHMNSEAGIFLHSLELIKANDTVDIEKFMEHKLDEMVWAADLMLPDMSKGEKKRTLALLHRIKQYRAENPRLEDEEVDTTAFSMYFAPFDKTYAARADAVLSELDNQLPN